jgi:threonine/homoserine/homoserine lactone efflux protein
MIISSFRATQARASLPWIALGMALGVLLACTLGRHTIVASTSPGAVWVINDVTGSVDMCSYMIGCASPGPDYMAAVKRAADRRAATAAEAAPADPTVSLP